MFFFFFFSSRRRHTRWNCDWSSDVCSSDLAEETGLQCDLGDEAGRTRYVDARGRNKEVRYFRMSGRGEPRPQNEVDEVRWVALDDAAGLLSYERDRELLSRLR